MARHSFVKSVPHDAGPEVPLDPVVAPAVANAIAATEPIHPVRWRAVSLILGVLIIAAVYSTAYTMLLTSKLTDTQTRLINAQACEKQYQQATIQIASDDRQASDDLFSAILKTANITRAQLDAAYSQYLQERAANNALREKLSQQTGTC